MNQQEPIDKALPHDPGVERAVLALIMVQGRPSLFEKLDGADFQHPLHKFLFSELRLMAEAGEQQGSSHALLRWFRQPAVLRRSDGLLEADDVAWTIADVSKEYATVGHEAYYLKVLARERMRRGLLALARGIEQHDTAEPLKPIETLNWAQRQFDLLAARGFELLPEDMEA